MKAGYLRNREVDGDQAVGIGFKSVFTLISVATMVGVAYGLVCFYGICSPFISNSFEMMDFGGFYSARYVWFSTFAFSMDLNVALDILGSGCANFHIGCQKIVGFLKWVAPHVMNLTTVMALYYSTYNRHSVSGNAFLLTLVSFIALEWFTRDVFESLSKSLGIEGYIFKLIYGVKKTDGVV